MFVRRYSRTVAGKKLTYFALVECVRTPDGPRQRVVAHLGELNQDEERRWQRSVVFHNCQGDAKQLRLFPESDDPALDDDTDVVRLRLDKVGWTNAMDRGKENLAFLSRPGRRYFIALKRAGLARLDRELRRPGWQHLGQLLKLHRVAVAEKAFRVLKSELLLRPIWHHYSGRTEAHVFICVLAYTLCKALDHLLKQAGLVTEVQKPFVFDFVHSVRYLCQVDRLPGQLEQPPADARDVSHVVHHPPRT